MQLAAEKTEIVCMSGPCVVPETSVWGKVAIGGSTTTMVVLGGQFTLVEQFRAALPVRSMKTARAWYKHKEPLTVPALPLARRFVAATAVCATT
eukprot:1165627-Amphidinium_carterae.1